MSEKKQQPAYPLRMPAELRDGLEALAKLNKRSLNAEIIARLEESISGEPAQPAALSEHEAAMHTLTSLYRETLDRIAGWKQVSGLSEIERIELLHEQATANYLRHAIARAALPADERTKARKETRPLGIDNDAYLAVKSAENATPTKRITRTRPKAPNTNE